MGHVMLLASFSVLSLAVSKEMPSPICREIRQRCCFSLILFFAFFFIFNAFNDTLACLLLYLYSVLFYKKLFFYKRCYSTIKMMIYYLYYYILHFSVKLQTPAIWWLVILCILVQFCVVSLFKHVYSLKALFLI